MIMKNKINLVLLFLAIFLLISIFTLSFFYFNSLKKSGDELESLEKTLEQASADSKIKDQVISEHKILIKNLNKLMSTVYYGLAVRADDSKSEKSFTAFSIYHNERFYIITAGHCIEYKEFVYTDFRFKSNTDNIWLYPELLYFENDYNNNRDFAIFYHPDIKTGLIADTINNEPRYVLGNIHNKINFLKEFDTAEGGESGSPILNSSCKLVGVVIKNNNEYTPINIITEKIDNLSGMR
jgi:hypothetical protein